MTPKEAATALDLLEKSRLMWTKEELPSEEVTEIPEGLEDCKVYHIDVMCWFGGTPYQFKITTLLNDQEACAAYNRMTEIIYNIAKSGQNSFSIKLRGKDGRIISRVFTNVVFLEHDIPMFKELLEDESSEE